MHNGRSNAENLCLRTSIPFSCLFRTGPFLTPVTTARNISQPSIAIFAAQQVQQSPGQRRPVLPIATALRVMEGKGGSPVGGKTR
jgi:hypothetical protein